MKNLNFRIRVSTRERAIVAVDGRPVRYLTPGAYWIAEALWPTSRVEVERYDLSSILADLSPEALALVPLQDLRVLELDSDQRAVLRYRGVPVRWLGEGVHQVWTAERTAPRGSGGVERPAVTVEVLDVSSVEVKPLRDEVRTFVPPSEYAEVTAPEGSVAVRYADGALDRVLPAGRHAAWTVARKVTFSVLELREQILQVTGQEVMTKDRVSLRLNLSAVYRVAEAERVATVAREPEDMVYRAMQMAAREAVAGRTLDELLAERHDLGAKIAGDVAARAEAVGLRVLDFGLKRPRMAPRRPHYVRLAVSGKEAIRRRCG